LSSLPMTSYFPAQKSISGRVEDSGEGPALLEG
jgi:hypothetical protein